MAVPKSRQYNPPGSGGGDGGLGAILAMFGLGSPVPEVTPGEVIPAAEGPELPSEAQRQTNVLPKVKQPSFSQNFFSKGQAGQNAASLQNSINLGAYDDIIKQQFQERGLQGQRDMEMLRTDNDRGNMSFDADQRKQLQEAKYREEAQARADAEERAIREANVKDALTRGFGLNTGLRDSSIPRLSQATAEGGLFKQNLLNAAQQTPDMATAIVNNEYAGLAKQPLANRLEEQNILAAQKKLPTLGFIPVSENNAMVDPATGQVISNVASRELDPAKDFRPGGITSKTLPGYNPGGFQKVPGGVASEVSQMNFNGGGQQQQLPLLDRLLQRGSGGVSSSPPMMRSSARSLPPPSPVAETKPIGEFQGPTPPLDFQIQNQPLSLNPIIDSQGTPPLNQVIQHYLQKGLLPALQGTAFEGSALDQYLKRNKMLQNGQATSQSY